MSHAGCYATIAALTANKMRLELRGCEVHLTHIPPPGDEAGLRKLGVNLTSDAQFVTNQLFGEGS